jgi:hypothetical protein
MEIEIANNIAVVGSNDTLLNNEYGELIDSHDQVVRFNNSITEGYENHVGRKTNIRISNGHVYPDDPVHHNQKVRLGSLAYKTANGLNDYILINADDYRLGLLNKIINEGIKGCPAAQKIRKSYTAGMSFVLMCVISGVVPDLFGFSLKMENRGNHYWEPAPPRRPGDRLGTNTWGHSPDLEHDLLLELEQANKIKIYR